MSSRFDLLTQQIFQKDFAACTAEELQHFADRYPSVAAGQFLLAEKLQQNGAPAWMEQAQKAALYYHQPVGFQSYMAHMETVFGTLPATEIPPAEEQVITTTPEPEATLPEAAPEQETVPEIPRPVLPKLDAPAVDTGFTFEPFHTVDYFASQGIKLSQEEIPTDKFGKQLMSFTQWLKTMKKLPASEHAKNMDPQSEQKVERMAEHSVSGAEVVTETMAEIWVQQGQPEKAAAVYHKLSLLHPSKKAYFASKLEKLKR